MPIFPFVMPLAVLLAACSASATQPGQPQDPTSASAEASAVQQSVDTAKKQSTAPYTVVAVGDIACAPDSPYFNDGVGTGTYCRQLATADAASAADPDAVLILGDIQYEVGALEAFDASFAQSWGRFLDRDDVTRNRLWPVPGNHEYATPGAAGYWAYFNGGTAQKPQRTGVAGRTGRGWYERTLGNWQVLALNDNCDAVPDACGAGSRQYRWLERRLKASTAKCTLAYWHQPLLTTGKEHGGQPDVRPFWKLLRAHDAEVVLNGHNHSYERFSKRNAKGRPDPGGIREFVVGTGGKNLYRLRSKARPRPAVGNDTTAGVLELQLAAKSYTWDFRAADFPENGDFTDSGRGRCA